MNLDAPYWENRYQSENTPWDIGEISRPLKNYVDILREKEQVILIPGAGYGHEAVYLHQNGFKQVLVCDWAPTPLERIKRKAPDFPEEHLIQEDFFQLSLDADLILEQTFFSAIDPSLRIKYAHKMQTLLKEGGRVVGLLFAHEFDHDGPPYGGTKEEYLTYFEPYFEIEKFEIAANSIQPRMGRELFFQIKKKS